MSNTVIAGRYKGRKIEVQDGRAYIRDAYVDFSKKNVLSYRKVDQQSGNAIAGALLAGAEGAIIASNSKTYLVEITWVDNEISLLEVTPNVFTAIVSSTYHSEDKSATFQKKTEKDEAENQLFKFIIGAIWVVVYLIASIE